MKQTSVSRETWPRVYLLPRRNRMILRILVGGMVLVIGLDVGAIIGTQVNSERLFRALYAMAVAALAYLLCSQSNAKLEFWPDVLVYSAGLGRRRIRWDAVSEIEIEESPLSNVVLRYGGRRDRILCLKIPITILENTEYVIKDFKETAAEKNIRLVQ